MQQSSIGMNSTNATEQMPVADQQVKPPNSGNDSSLIDEKAKNHILDGEKRPNGTYSGGHRAGTNFPGKSEFPVDWPDDKILREISDVATDPTSSTVPQNGATKVNGTRDGIDIEVIIRKGRIVSGYPTNTPRNPL